MTRFLFSILIFSSVSAFSQADTTIVEDEEDYSMYDNLEFVDEAAKRFCTSKVQDLSPAKLIWVGFDYQAPHQLNAGSYLDQNTEINFDSQEVKIPSGAGGLRLGANIPVISRNNIIIQLGANLQQTEYFVNQTEDMSAPTSKFHPMRELIQNGRLNTLGVNSTIFKPFNEKYFLVAQVSQDWNGDYALGDFKAMHNPTTSAAVIFGKKPNDRKQIGFGLSRTYRGGELLYIPVMMLNWTAPNRKWGVEVLAPARAHYRRTFNSRTLMLLGYELEGNSYIISNPTMFSNSSSTFALRRSELRFRAVLETSIKGFIWLSWQVGYRYNYRYNLDVWSDGRDFFRGFTGDQPYAIENELKGTMYSMVTINLVSP